MMTDLPVPHCCAVVGCSHNSMRDWQYKYYLIPSEKDKRGRILEERINRRKAWIQSLHRDDLTDSKIKYMRICSDHFISGKPAAFADSNNPDYIPNLKMGYGTSNTNHQIALPNDMENWVRFNLMGGNTRKILKKDVVPRYFTCAEDRKRADSPKPQPQASIKQITPKEDSSLETPIMDPQLSHNQIKLVDINKIINNTFTFVPEMKNPSPTKEITRKVKLIDPNSTQSSPTNEITRKVKSIEPNSTQSSPTNEITRKVKLIEPNSTQLISNTKINQPVRTYILNNFQFPLLQQKDIYVVPVSKNTNVDVNSLHMNGTMSGFSIRENIQKPKIPSKQNVDIPYRCLLKQKTHCKIDLEGFSYYDRIGFKKHEQASARRCNLFLERYKNVWETSLGKLVTKRQRAQKMYQKKMNKVKDCSVILSKSDIHRYLAKQPWIWKDAKNDRLNSVSLDELLRLKRKNDVFIMEDNLRFALELPRRRRGFLVTKHQTLINLFYQTFPRFRTVLHWGKVRIVSEEVFNAYNSRPHDEKWATKSACETKYLEESCEEHLKSSITIVENSYTVTNDAAQDHNYCVFIKQEPKIEVTEM